MFGVLNVNKPAFLTSRDVVNRVCKKLGTKRVGHAGTLDPMATGVLLVVIGPATRLVNHLHQLPKSYVGSFQFGAESTTDDRLGDVTMEPNPPVVTRDQLVQLLPEFLGSVEQVPPKFSAKKIQGKRAYRLAREGKDVQLAPRKVEIFNLAVSGFSYPQFELNISCGTGTYVRSLGRDLAVRLGTRAMMTELVRTSIGHFDLKDSIQLEEFEDSEPSVLSPLQCVPDLPRFVVSDEQVKKLTDGCFVKQEYIAKQCDVAESSHEVVAIDESGKMIAVMSRFDKNNFKPKINFCKHWLE